MVSTALPSQDDIADILSQLEGVVMDVPIQASFESPYCLNLGDDSTQPSTKRRQKSTQSEPSTSSELSNSIRKGRQVNGASM